MARNLHISELKKLYPDALLRSGTLIYEGVVLGRNFISGHNAVIREHNTIGDNVLVGVNSYLGPHNTIGNNVRIHTGCFLEGTRIENNVIIGPHVVFTNDPYPPCKECTEAVGGAHVGEGSVIGAHVTVLPGVKIGRKVLVGAGSVVTDDLEDEYVYVGNPARKLKHISKIKHTHP